MPTAASRTSSLALVLAVGIPALSIAAPGKVLSVSASRAYLDKGSADGLAPGQVVTLRRGSESAGTCQIEEASRHAARCRGTGLRPGDRFETTPPTATPQRTHAAPALPDPQELARRYQALVEAPLAKVPNVAPARPGASLRLHSEASLTHGSWMSAGLDGFHGERLDVAIRGAELGRGFRLWADLTAVQWIARPQGARYRSGTSTHVLLRELAVSWRELGMPVTFAAGRVRPWRVPGISTFDGAQVAWLRGDGLVEVGAFGGELPNVQTLLPQEAWLAGLYWSASRLGRAGEALRVLHHEARVDVVDGSALGSGSFARRFEAEATLQASLWRSFDAAVDLRVGYADASGANLDAARVDLGVRPAESLRLTAGYRFDGLRQPELAAVDPSYRGRGQHADLGVAWDARPWLTLGLTGGYAQESDADRLRGYGGPEVGLPQLFGCYGGLSLGYAEELGWTAGRTGWVQAVVHPAQRFQVLARVSYLQDSPHGGPSEHDLGLVLNASAPLVSWLSLRFSFMGRLGLDGLRTDPNLGFAGTLGLRGEL